ncbi:MAG: bifunctional DNA-binding transcriptional regulator/O6-methylguanine-DNA methyltransferase Ada [Nannocystaceae bacterium]|nr:bifunctional DNA-binding transcriptional regulator/O6-methylguanine-DNA methyltransferase Ada [bacterium]
MDDEARWAAVINRDRTHARAFIYAVRTTGIYCVPSCPSRRPKRDNVEFFSTPRRARDAGYRACKRCLPDAQQASDVELVADLCAFIFACDAPPSLDEMAAHAEISASHLHRTFKAHTGQTPREFAADVRAQRVRAALSAGVSVTQALYESGYGSASRFYSDVSTTLGMAPQRYQNRGEGVDVRMTLAETSLGVALVAATPTGICGVALGDDPETLVAELRERFSQANFVATDPTFEGHVASVVAALEGMPPSLELPLDIRGTAFQHRVWRALAAMPQGQTASYADIAAAIGRPRAVRAVAAACAANEIAVLIPCHRVLRSDGSLCGYRWGLERKRALLDRETGP